MKGVAFGAKANNILVVVISFIEKLSLNTLNAFNEGARRTVNGLLTHQHAKRGAIGGQIIAKNAIVG